jgi:hypothetical protein
MTERLIARQPFNANRANPGGRLRNLAESKPGVIVYDLPKYLVLLHCCERRVLGLSVNSPVPRRI